MKTKKLVFGPLLEPCNISGFTISAPDENGNERLIGAIGLLERIELDVGDTLAVITPLKTVVKKDGAGIVWPQTNVRVIHRKANGVGGCVYSNLTLVHSSDGRRLFNKQFGLDIPMLKEKDEKRLKAKRLLK